MLDINVNEIKAIVDNLKGIIDEYEEIQLNLFSQLRDSCINWHDINSMEFDNKLYLEKQEADLFLQTLRSKREIFNFIYDKYSEIGKKITCNLNNKTSLINSINDCYNQAVSIVNEFNYVDFGFWYNERDTILAQRAKAIAVRDKIDSIRRSVAAIFSKIENIEALVCEKIKMLDEIKISDLDYNFRGGF